MSTQIKLRRVLTEGGIALGSCIDSFSPAVAELAGYAGLDFLRIDTEYSWRRDDSLEHMIRACRIGGATPLVRVEKGQPYLISKAFQAGAEAILVSDITGYEEAVEVVRAARFAPNGVRGYSIHTAAGRWGMAGGARWVEQSDAELMVGIMIENREILGDLDRIFAIRGLDFCLFGPSDFSLSMGYREPRTNDETVQDALRRTCEAAAAHGKWVAMGIKQPWAEQAARYTAMGCRMIELSHDVAILASVWSAARKEIRES